MTNLDQAVVLVSGASGGFGQEFTKQLLAANSYLVLSDRDSSTLSPLSNAIGSEIATGKILAVIEADLATSAGCLSLYEQVKSQDISVDILINNAGIALFGRIDEIPPSEWEKLMQVNLLTPMYLSSLFAADMIARQHGHIVNMSSVAGLKGVAGLSHYNASKFGLRGFSEGLRWELKPHQVKVSTVYPFFSRTPILNSPGYGSLAKGMQRDYLKGIATEPEMVIKNIIRGIRQDKQQIFPDFPSKVIDLTSRYSPWLLAVLTNFLDSKMK